MINGINTSLRFDWKQMMILRSKLKSMSKWRSLRKLILRLHNDDIQLFYKSFGFKTYMFFWLCEFWNTFQIKLENNNFDNTNINKIKLKLSKL